LHALGHPAPAQYSGRRAQVFEFRASARADIGDLHGDIAELDINPLVVLPKGAVALDALVVCR